MSRPRRTRLAAAVLGTGFALSWTSAGQAETPKVPAPSGGQAAPAPARGDRGPAAPAEAPKTGNGGNRIESALPNEVFLRSPLIDAPPSSLVNPNYQPIDLNTALRLANVQNPQMLLARQRVVEATALRQLAVAQFLPTLNGGMNYDSHTGVLQQSNGNILTVQRSAVYVGAGANAVAAGTVGIPGIVLTGNVAEAIFGYLGSQQFVREREFANVAVRNQMFLRVAVAYSELTRAEAYRAVAIQNRNEVREVARLTADYAATGEGRAADANRAATELAHRETEVQEAEGEVNIASARLCGLLNLDPSIRLHPTDTLVVPQPIVPDPTPVQELIALGLLQRPELGERRAVIAQAFLALENARILPFSPTILVGFSAGGFGGGSNLVSPVFGGFGSRSDFDAMAYWTIRNLGVGNVAMIRAADARLQISRFQELAILNQVRAEVAEAYAKTHARYAQILTNEHAVAAGLSAFKEDFDRIKLRAVRTVLPIELINSFDLLSRARLSYLNAIVDYNVSQFELYVALGQPPADALARPVPTEGYAPSYIQRTGAPAPAMPTPEAVPPGARVPAAPANPPRVATPANGPAAAAAPAPPRAPAPARR